MFLGRADKQCDAVCRQRPDFGASALFARFGPCDFWFFLKMKTVIKARRFFYIQRHVCRTRVPELF